MIPKVVVSFAIKNIVSVGVGLGPDLIGISATNHGPGPVILNTISLIEDSYLKRIFRKQKHAVIMHDYLNPHSGKLPAKLEVGETLNLFLDFNAECFLRHPFSNLGISDSFGRTNWADDKNMKSARKRWNEGFLAAK